VDAAFIVPIFNIVLNAMVGSDSILSGELVVATFFLVYVFKDIQYRFSGFGKIVKGEALVLIC
jgi:uncharacterized membrane protein YcaP (DUF421 family)